MSVNKTKLCCVFNTPSLYRESIYKFIERAYDCDWYFEDTDNKLKEFDTTLLKNVVRLHAYNMGPFYGVKGTLALLKKKEYSQYLMMGHSRNLSILAFVLIKRLFYQKKKVYLWTHGFYGKETLFEKVWKKLFFSSADGLFVYGDYACKIMVRQYGFNPEKLHAIHNSLNYDMQLKLRNEITKTCIYYNYFENHNPVIIFIGRLTEVKKLEMLVNAIYLLKCRGEFYNLAFIGDGPRRQYLEEQVSELGINKQVWFYGACYNEKINAELIFNADLCVAPGNIGLTSIHVLMFGCPAISHGNFTHQMPEFEAIKEGITGAFFEMDNQESLNAAISNWFHTKLDKREEVRLACYNEIDTNWNPYYQIKIIKSIIQ